MALFLCLGNGQAEALNKNWQPLVRSKLAAISVEKVIYEKENNPHFFVQIRIDNLTKRNVYVDLQHYFDVIYPNQWVFIKWITE